MFKHLDRQTVLRSLRQAWRAVPDQWRQRLQPVARELAGIAYRFKLPNAAALADLRQGPIIYSRFANATGLAEAARLNIGKLRDAGFDVREHDLSALLSPDIEPQPLPDVPGGVWIIHANPPQAEAALAIYGSGLTVPKYTIGYWAWELAQPPRHWARAAAAFHEIWVPSRFVARAFKGFTPGIRVMPHPIPFLPSPSPVLIGPSPSEPQVDTRDRPLSVVVPKSKRPPMKILAMCDARSIVARKNPFGALDIFLLAFPNEGAATLTLKISGLSAAPDLQRQLLKRAQGRRDVSILTDKLSESDMADMLDQHDVLLSPHRSEGFGLPIAEMMALGKVVVATDYSANTEFMPKHSAQRIPFSLVPVRNGGGVYQRFQVWADPDLPAAAERLKALAASIDLRTRLGSENAQLVRVLHQAWTRSSLNTAPFAAYALELVADIAAPPDKRQAAE